MHKLLSRAVTVAAIMSAFATTGHAQPASPEPPPADGAPTPTTDAPPPEPESTPEGTAKKYKDELGPVGAFTTREICNAQAWDPDPDRDAGTRLKAGKGFGRAKEYEKAREQFRILLCTYNQYDAYGNLAVTNRALAAKPGAPSWLLPQSVEAARLCLSRIPHAPFDSDADREDLKNRVSRIIEENKDKVVHLVLSAKPKWATLKVDGVEVHADQLRNGVVVSAGEEHIIEATAEDYTTQERKVTLGGGVNEHVHFELVKPKPVNGNGKQSGDGDTGIGTPMIIGGTVALVGVGAAVAGGVMLGLAAGKSDDAQLQADAIRQDGGRCRPASAGFETRCDSLHALTDDVEGLHNPGLGLLIAGGGLIATGAIIAIALPAGSDDSGGVQAAPIVTSNSGGIVLTGSF